MTEVVETTLSSGGGGSRAAATALGRRWRLMQQQGDVGIT